MSNKTIYTSYIDIDGNPATDFVCYENGRPVWAFQAFNADNKPCNHYRVRMGKRGSFVTTTQDEALNRVSGSVVRGR